MKKILILSANSGHGHTSLAFGIKEAIEDFTSIPFGIEIINPLPHFYGNFYSKLNSDWKYLWGLIWHFTNNKPGSLLLAKSTSFFLNRKMIKIINTYEPDLIISPVELVLPDLRKIGNQLSKKPKVAVYIADPFTPHISWFSNPSVDIYLSPTDITTKLCSQNGVDMAKVKQVGWLTRKNFFRKLPARVNVRKELGLDPVKTTLFLGGSGNGGGDIHKILSLILADKSIMEKFQVIVNTGNNDELIRKVTPLCRSSKSFLLTPFIKDMPSYLYSSDVVMGKAGPNFMFECIHLGKPFIATGHLPGQEEGNVKFIKDKNIGWVAADESEAVNIIKSILKNKTLLDEKKRSLKELSASNRWSAKNIAHQVEILVNEKQK